VSLLRIADEELRAKLLNIILLIGIGLVLVMGLGTFVLPSAERGPFLLLLSALLSPLLLAYALLRAGRIRAASWLVVILFSAILFWYTLVSEGLRSSAALSFFSVIIFAGLLISGRAAVGVAVIAILAQTIALAAESSGWMPVQIYGENAILRWMSNAINLFLGAIFLALTNRNLRETLGRALSNEQRYLALYDQSHDAVFLVDLDYDFIALNRQGLQMLGYKVEQELVGKSIKQFVPVDEWEAAVGNFERIAAGETLPRVEGSIWARGGARVQVEISMALVHDSGGSPQHFQVVLSDITVRKHAEEVLREKEQRYRALFESTNDAVFLLNLDLVYLAVNQQAADLLGYEVDEIVGRPIEYFVTPHEIKDSRDILEPLLAGQILPVYERTFVRKDGSQITVEISSALVFDIDNNPLHIQSIARDISLRKSLEERLRLSLAEMVSLSRTDPLTGILNRRAIVDYAEAELNRSAREDSPVSFLLLDMDNLKSVNDSYGHLAGDQTLQILATTLHKWKRGYDWIGRWGGDEFLIVLPVTRSKEAGEVAERLRQKVMEKPVKLPEGNEVTVLVSIGVTCNESSSGRVSNLDALIHQADEALYNAKKLKSGVHIYQNTK
jgi:diguanylate cyclase (GGDEF)-like protein/PAS domain S-box-containing protein